MFKPSTIPRITYINKNWTLKEVHMNIFNFLKGLISNWYSLYEKDSSENSLPPFKKPSIDEKDDRELTKEEFLNLSL